MGAENGGNMFPGVTSGPYSVVKLGPDCGPDAYSGYSPTGNITAFSMMHESGTGGAPKYGVVSQQPVSGLVVNPLEDLSVPRSSPDQAQVGFYESSLSSGITVQLAATPHAAMFSYLFPESSQPNVVVDVSHVLTSVERPNLSQQYVDGNLTVLPDGSYQGSGTYNNGWNLAPDWTIYFCGYFDTPVTSFQTFHGNGTTLSYYGSDTSASGTEGVSAFFGVVTSLVVYAMLLRHVLWHELRFKRASSALLSARDISFGTNSAATQRCCPCSLVLRPLF